MALFGIMERLTLSLLLISGDSVVVGGSERIIVIVIGIPEEKTIVKT